MSHRIDRLACISAAAAAACIVASRPPLFHIRSRAYNYNYNDIVLREVGLYAVFTTLILHYSPTGSFTKLRGRDGRKKLTTCFENNT